jgi:hypothetical protein
LFIVRLLFTETAAKILQRDAVVRENFDETMLLRGIAYVKGQSIRM